VNNFSADLLQVNWKEGLLFRVVALEIHASLTVRLACVIRFVDDAKV